MNQLPYFFPIFFIGMVVFVMFFLSKKGWADLVNEYQCDNNFEGKRIGIISAGINGVSYNNCLLLKYNEEGFYLRPILIFRLFHKPIFIPWKAIKDIRDKKILFVVLKEMVIGEPAIAFIQLRKSSFSKIEPFIISKGTLNKMRTNFNT